MPPALTWLISDPNEYTTFKDKTTKIIAEFLQEYKKLPDDFVTLANATNGLGKIENKNIIDEVISRRDTKLRSHLDYYQFNLTRLERILDKINQNSKFGWFFFSKTHILNTIWYLMDEIKRDHGCVSGQLSRIFRIYNFEEFTPTEQASIRTFAEEWKKTDTN